MNSLALLLFYKHSFLNKHLVILLRLVGLWCWHLLISILCLTSELNFWGASAINFKGSKDNEPAIKAVMLLNDLYIPPYTSDCRIDKAQSYGMNKSRKVWTVDTQKQMQRVRKSFRIRLGKNRILRAQKKSLTSRRYLPMI